MQNDKRQRNNLCHCGSKKKYKKCCMISTTVNNRNQLFKLKNHVIEDLLKPYFIDELHPIISFATWVDCLPRELHNLLDHNEVMDVFSPLWSLFNWVNEKKHVGFANFNPKKTVAANYLDAYGENLEPKEKQFIEMMEKGYYSFYRVVDVNADQSLKLIDILQETTHTVFREQSQINTLALNPGNIVFAQLLMLDDQSVIIGMMPAIIDELVHPAIVYFRDAWLREKKLSAWTPEILRKESQYNLLSYFFWVFDFKEEICDILIELSKEDQHQLLSELSKHEDQHLSTLVSQLLIPHDFDEERADRWENCWSDDPSARECMETWRFERAKHWINVLLPALGNQSPRKAIKTADGRHRVIALLLELDKQNELVGNPSVRVETDYIRDQLAISSNNTAA